MVTAHSHEGTRSVRASVTGEVCGAGGVRTRERLIVSTDHELRIITHAPPATRSQSNTDAVSTPLIVTVAESRSS